MIKTSNQEFITFNESMIYFYLIGVNFLFILSLLAKHLSKYYLKNENGESFGGRFEDIVFSCVLLPHINFLSSKYNRKLKIDPKMLKQ